MKSNIGINVNNLKPEGLQIHRRNWQCAKFSIRCFTNKILLKYKILIPFKSWYTAAYHQHRERKTSFSYDYVIGNKIISNTLRLILYAEISFQEQHQMYKN